MSIPNGVTNRFSRRGPSDCVRPRFGGQLRRPSASQDLLGDGFASSQHRLPYVRRKPGRHIYQVRHEIHLKSQALALIKHIFFVWDLKKLKINTVQTNK